MNMYLAMERELLVVRQQQGKWQTEAHLVGMQPTCVSVDPLRQERVYCGTFGRGLWRSSDAGCSWESVGEASMRSWKGEGITHPELIAVAVSLTERAGGLWRRICWYVANGRVSLRRWRQYLARTERTAQASFCLNLGFARPALQKPCTLDY